jgi:hypothetical protein
MFNWLSKKNQGDQSDIRDTLFGDMPLSAWAGQSHSTSEPWLSFTKAREYIESESQELAINELKKITEMANLESRHYLQAWHFLNQLGVKPPDTQAKEVYGVIVEVTMNQGLDIVAAYADHNARYFNYSGAAVIWENPDDSLIRVIDDLLNAGKCIIHKIGPWEDVRPPAPPKGQVRVSMLTPGGLHFGQAPFDALSKDEMGGPIIAAATNLMQALIAKSSKSSA